MRMHRHYTPEEIQFVKENIRGRPYVEMTKTFNKRFGTRITLKQMQGLLYKHGFRNGIGVVNGYAHPCKGKKIGHHGSNYSNYRPLGGEFVNGEYIYVKTGHRIHKPKHLVLWEKTNGKVPKGHVVTFADGNKRNFTLDNLLLISRKENAVMNRLGLRSQNAGLTKAGKTIADIKMAIAARKRQIKGKARSKQRRTG